MSKPHSHSGARGALLGAVLALSAAIGAAGAHETVKPLFQQALPNVPGKTFTTVIVDFPPGVEAVPHRHGDAFVYAYVLSGVVRSQLEGEPVKTYQAGQFWSEPPGAHHLATVNASATAPARLLVTFVADTGVALKVDDAPAAAH
ncbi:cupin domain-containing protein [Caulobacter soli]|uniref:cupin domain-containing protein n=1 Tax=Caulobacter soli TaxID=2708539 RepID=UPI0013EADA32|nr:cupin domain-containing protein [Caulobacter soli]